MIDYEEANEYLESQGVELPQLVVDALVEQANSIQTCLDDNYSPTIAKLIQVYLIGLTGLAQTNKYVSSQSAPSGASRSFKIANLAERWKAQFKLIESLDTEGCATDLMPDDPTNTAHAGIWIGKGGCL